MPSTTMSQEIAGIFGVKVASIIAGFAGGVVSLAFLKQLTPLQMVLAVLTGAVTAGYLNPLVAPVISKWTSLSLAPELEGTTAFLLGLCAMNIIPGIVRISEIFKKDPMAMITKGKGEQS